MSKRRFKQCANCTDYIKQFNDCDNCKVVNEKTITNNKKSN